MQCSEQSPIGISLRAIVDQRLLVVYLCACVPFPAKIVFFVNLAFAEDIGIHVALVDIAL